MYKVKKGQFDITPDDNIQESKAFELFLDIFLIWAEIYKPGETIGKKQLVLPESG